MRNTNQRKAIFKNLSREIMLHQKIVTTLAKAKSVKPIVEKLITRGKKYLNTGAIYHLRKIDAYIGADVREKMLAICKNSMNRNGGYIRILRMRNRQGDNAPRAYIGVVDSEKKDN